MPVRLDSIPETKPIRLSSIGGTETVLPSAAPDYNSVLDISSRYEIPPEDAEGIYNPLTIMVDAVADPQDVDVGISIPPEEFVQPQIGVAPEKKPTFLESILGFTYPARPPNWENASPIERFNFATLPVSDFLGRIGGKAASDWRLTTKEDVQKVLASEYHDTLKWYQKSPEAIGWTAEKIAEYQVLKTLFAISGLSDILTATGQRAAAPFISKGIVDAGGIQTLKTLSGAGMRNLLRQGLVNFLQAAPENVAFIGSWSGLSSVMAGNSPKQVALDAAKGAGWAAGLTAGFSGLAAVAATPEMQQGFHNAIAYLARKYPRLVDFVSRDVEKEIVDQTVKAYGEHIGQDIRFTELPKNVQASFKNVARAVKKELVKAAQKEEAMKAYWSAKVAKEAKAPVPPPTAEPAVVPATPEQEIIERIVNPVRVRPAPTVPEITPVRPVAAITPAKAPKAPEIAAEGKVEPIEIPKKMTRMAVEAILSTVDKAYIAKDIERITQIKKALSDRIDEALADGRVDDARAAKEVWVGTDQIEFELVKVKRAVKPAEAITPAEPTVIPPKAFRPGFVELPPQLQDIAESVKDMGVALGKNTNDLIKSLEFYPDLPNELRNDIRTDVVGAVSKARDDVYSKMSGYIWGGLKDKDVQKAIEIFFVKDQLSRTQLGKGNPEINLEEAYGFLDDTMTTASSEAVEAANKIRVIFDKYFEINVKRGHIDEESFIQDYAPHHVLDYTPDWKFNVGIPTRLKRPFRGYVKKAVGTTKEYRQDKDAILGSLLIMQHDNIIEDFIEGQAEKYNILTTMSKEQRQKLFGVDKAGRVNVPKPGRIYVIDDKRYRAYTPDIPFTRQLFPTEEGLMAMGRYKNVSLIPEQIYNLFKEFSERGSRPMYLINRATSIWKSMAILSHFPSFNVNNMVGDTWMALSQHPAPSSLLAEYPTSIQYLTGKGSGPYFEKLHKGIIEEDVLTGTFAASEMAQMRSSKNPLAWLLEKTQEFSNFREGINRIAYYSSLLKAQERGEADDMIKAHNWINTDGLDTNAALGKISRDVLVDYGATSKTFRRFVRGGVAPFATWYVKGSRLMWSWAMKHWGKALAVFMAPPVVATIYNHRRDDIIEMEKQLPDYVRNRTHFVLGENPDGTVRVWSFQFPQDALIGTKVFSIFTDYVNRVYNGEMSADDAVLLFLRNWGIKEAKGIAYLSAPLIRYINGRMSTDHKDPYDKAPIYTTDPARMTWWDRKKDESLFFLKTMTPFLSASIGDYEKGLPLDVSLKKLLDNFAGKGALGIYDVNKKGNLVIERNGEKYEFDYDMVAQIHYIVAKEERYLDKLERAFIASGLSPDKFADTSLCYNQLFEIYDLWGRFEPGLAKQEFASSQEKAHAIMKVLDSRFVNRLTDLSNLRKWYNVKLLRADTDEEKVALRKEMEQIQTLQMFQTITRLPLTSRTLAIESVLQKSKLPWELILEIGISPAKPKKAELETVKID